MEGEPLWVEPFLAALATSGQVQMACDHCGIDRTTPYQVRKNNPKYNLGERWRAALREFRDNFRENVEPIAFDCCLTGCSTKTYEFDDAGKRKLIKEVLKQEVALIIFMLKAHGGDRYQFEEIKKGEGVAELAEKLKLVVEQGTKTVGGEGK